VTAYPNPANGTLYLHGLSGSETIYLMDASGRLIHSQKATNTNETVRVSGFQAGMYFIRIERGHHSESLKVFIY